MSERVYSPSIMISQYFFSKRVDRQFNKQDLKHTPLADVII